MLNFRPLNPLNFGGESGIRVFLNEKEIGMAVYRISDNSLQLNWIEIDESEQGKGYGAAVLDHIASLAIAKHLDLVIKVLNDELLDGFYFKWFESWGKSKGIDKEKIIAMFNMSIVDDINPKLFLKRNVLIFSEATDDDSYEHNSIPN